MLITILANKIDWSKNPQMWVNIFTLAFPYVDAFRPACDFLTQDNYARGEARADAPTDDNRLFSNKYSDVRRDSLLSFQNMWRSFVPGAAGAAVAVAPEDAAATAVISASKNTQNALALAAIQYGQVCMLIDAVDNFDAERGVPALKLADAPALLAADSVRDAFIEVRTRFAELQMTNKEWGNYATRGFKWDTDAADKTIQYLGARVARLELPRALPDASGRLARSMLAGGMLAVATKNYTDTRFRQLEEVRKHLSAFARRYAAHRTTRYRYGFAAGIRSVAPSAASFLPVLGAFENNPSRDIMYNLDVRAYDAIFKFGDIMKATPGHTLVDWVAQCSALHAAMSSVLNCYVDEDLIAAWLAFGACKLPLEYPLRRPPKPPSYLSAAEAQEFTRRFARPIWKMYHVALGRDGTYATRVAPTGNLEVALGDEPATNSALSLLVRATLVYGVVGPRCRQLRAEIRADRKALHDSTDAERGRLQNALENKTVSLDAALFAIERTLPASAWAQGGAPVALANSAVLDNAATILVDLVKKIGDAEQIVFTTNDIVDNQAPEPRTEPRLQDACEAIRAACAAVDACAQRDAAVLGLAPAELAAVAAATAFLRELANELLHGKRRPSSVEESGATTAAPVAAARPATAAYVPSPASALVYEWKDFGAIESELAPSDYQSSYSEFSSTADAEPPDNSRSDYASAPVVVQFDSMELLKSNASSLYNMIKRTSGSVLAPALYGLVIDKSENGKTSTHYNPSQAEINELLCRIGAEIGIRAPVDRATLSSSRGRPLKGWLVRYRPGSSEHFETFYIRSDTVTGSSIQNFTQVSP
jgi:hypothetical protein